MAVLTGGLANFLIFQRSNTDERLTYFDKSYACAGCGEK